MTQYFNPYRTAKDSKPIIYAELNLTDQLQDIADFLGFAGRHEVVPVSIHEWDDETYDEITKQEPYAPRRYVQSNPYYPDLYVCVYHPGFYPGSPDDLHREIVAKALRAAKSWDHDQEMKKPCAPING